MVLTLPTSAQLNDDYQPSTCGADMFLHGHVPYIMLNCVLLAERRLAGNLADESLFAHPRFGVWLDQRAGLGKVPTVERKHKKVTCN